MNLALHTRSLIQSGKLNSNGSDLRFVDSSGITLFPFWNETEFNSKTTNIWFNISSITNRTNTTIFMYYGNPSALSARNGTKTLDFFDDAETNTEPIYNQGIEELSYDRPKIISQGNNE
jgi:hypothetical protein